jgi:hypothetical protein
MTDWGDKTIKVKSDPSVSMADAVRRVIRNYPAGNDQSRTVPRQSTGYQVTGEKQ